MGFTNLFPYISYIILVPRYSWWKGMSMLQCGLQANLKTGFNWCRSFQATSLRQKGMIKHNASSRIVTPLHCIPQHKCLHANSGALYFLDNFPRIFQLNVRVPFISPESIAYFRTRRMKQDSSRTKISCVRRAWVRIVQTYCDVV